MLGCAAHISCSIAVAGKDAVAKLLSSLNELGCDRSFLVAFQKEHLWANCKECRAKHEHMTFQLGKLNLFHRFTRLNKNIWLLCTMPQKVKQT
jgi:hypothetical protein